uniref:Uncharacterized protein n=1 Tax=Kalanchoe fedtschenkoi TaxID=63787 RepID=A0A7N0UVC2_KALFE
MDSGGANATGVDLEGTGSNRSNKNCNRHTPQQIQYLETLFKECAHPDEKQQKQISSQLRLDPRQIKFWFQNKRTQMKTQLERADNNSLRCQNERFKSENLAMRDALKNILCPSCGGPPFGKDEHHSNVEKLQLENAILRKESETISDVEKSVMVETAVGAMDELLKVLRSDKPLWTNNTGRYSLNRDCYEKVFLRPHHYKRNISAKLESSKDSCDVDIKAIVLVNMLLDPSMWLDLFPTLVTSARTLHVVQTGMPGNRSGSLHLNHEIMHALSPLVAPREFYFLRYCQQVEIDTWVIADVSYGIPRENDENLVSNCLKLPSGCMIQDMPDGHSKVTWVELVEVNDKASTHRFYRDIVTSGLVFGAERWIATLKQMCERAVLSNGVPANNQGATLSAEGKMSVMDLSHRMVKTFCATLNMPINKLAFGHVSETNNSGVRVSTRPCTDPNKPQGMVVCMATSVWLPLCPQHVFAFFQDNNMRSQWDFLSHGNPVKEIARAVSGRHTENNISIFQPVAHDKSHTVILQESLVDFLGYYLIFAPLESTAVKMVVAGLNSSNTPVLPSGFVIVGDGRGVSTKDVNKTSSGKDGGSLLTVAFQMLLSGTTYTKQKHMEVVADANSLIGSTVEKIKASLTPSGSSKTVTPSESICTPP